MSRNCSGLDGLDQPVEFLVRVGRQDLSQLTLRAIAAELGEQKNLWPQKIKHHIGQLEKRGLIRFYYDKDTYLMRCHIDRVKIAATRRRLIEEQPTKACERCGTSWTVPVADCPHCPTH